MKQANVHVVPDAMVVLGESGGDSETAAVSLIEFDAGTERLKVWEGKAKAYAGLAGRALYGASRWTVVALVPSARRARAVAEAVTRAGAGHIVRVGILDALLTARALEPVLWKASALAGRADAPPTESLMSGLRVLLEP